jgi:hypothetical protein
MNYSWTVAQAVRQVYLLKQADSHILRFGYGGLARDPNLPKVFIQGEKSGDFLSGLLKKYDSYLVKKTSLY